ncbi:unnamed protein product [Chondrus crispus]|uniref:Uncharacterized protein n=1 Tax=Chondrus crispus TaxID=2769 RepID=R7QBJ8_CHOCR|nr:unnamed protein product [Chondrus crispus]XP_005714973.1 unnamed protein product [Chondrus crispus]CDF35153.1 unnamed protein product [Chondrus crispus]CDF35154.1 unnamed protein product [Chondrus crispus]|eukprot:XP_005714972.1 unnamed protein product [Chondrus crispus]
MKIHAEFYPSKRSTCRGMSQHLTDAEGKITRRYDPVVSGRFSGIVMMSDRSPTEPEDIVEMQTLNTAPQPVSTPQTPAVLLNANDPNDEEEEEEGEEVPPLEPFVYRDEADESKKDDEEKDGGDSASKEDADVNMNDSGDGQTSV